MPSLEQLLDDLPALLPRPRFRRTRRRSGRRARRRSARKSARLHSRVVLPERDELRILRSSQRWNVALTSSCQAATSTTNRCARLSSSQRASRSSGVVVGSGIPSTGTYGFGFTTSSRRKSPTIGQNLVITSCSRSMLGLDLLCVGEPAQEIGDVLALGVLAPEIFEQAVDRRRQTRGPRSPRAPGSRSPASGSSAGRPLQRRSRRASGRA